MQDMAFSLRNKGKISRNILMKCCLEKISGDQKSFLEGHDPIIKMWMKFLKESNLFDLYCKKAIVT